MTRLTRRRRGALLAVALLALLALPAPRAAAQGADDVSLDLLEQRLWHDEDARLGLRLRVRNGGDAPLDGFVIQLFVYDRVASRTELRESFDERPDGAPIAFYSEAFFDDRVAPGEAREVTLDPPVSELDPGLPDDNGVYPLEIALATPDEPLDSVTSELIYYPGEVDTRLNIAPVVPVTELPARDASDMFRSEPRSADDVTLAEALGRRGWLRALVDELQNSEGLRVGLAPAPRLLEEVADMADGFRVSADGEPLTVAASARAAVNARTFLTRLRALLTNESRVQPLLVPYSAPDLPTTAAVPADDRLRQWNVATDVLLETLGRNIASDLTGSWLWPPAGRLDERSLLNLQESEKPPTGPLRTLFAPASIVGAGDAAAVGCPRPFGTFACAVRISTFEGAVTGFVADGGLQGALQALAEPGDQGLDLQRLLAETAMIREEIPGVAGRVVHVAVPSPWRASPRLLGRLLRSFANAPWLRSRTPTEALDVVARTVPRRVVGELERPKVAPGSEYLARVGEASATVESFATIDPRPEVLDRLRRDVLVAQSRMWWGDPALALEGLGHALDAQQEARDYLANVTLGGRDTITLTSRRQELPLVLFNANPFRVTLTMHLESPGLDFGGASELERTITLPPRLNRPVGVPVTVRSSGQFPLEVRLTTPDGMLDAGARPLTQFSVRSTDFNQIAVGITFGAAAFLLLFYVARYVRRRRNPAEGTASGTTA